MNISNCRFSEANMTMALSFITETSRVILRAANTFNLVSKVTFFKYVLIPIIEENDIFSNNDLQ